jgi:hypothetical protein
VIGFDQKRFRLRAIARAGISKSLQKPAHVSTQSKTASASQVEPIAGGKRQRPQDAATEQLPPPGRAPPRHMIVSDTDDESDHGHAGDNDGDAEMQGVTSTTNEIPMDYQEHSLPSANDKTIASIGDCDTTLSVVSPVVEVAAVVAAESEPAAVVLSQPEVSQPPILVLSSPEGMTVAQRLDARNGPLAERPTALPAITDAVTQADEVIKQESTKAGYKQVVADLERRAKDAPGNHDNVAIFVRNLSSDRAGIRDAALTALRKAVEADQNILSSHTDRLLTLSKRKGKGIATCGLQALALLAPHVLEDLAPTLISQWHGANDEGAVEQFWRLVSNLPMRYLQQNATAIRAIKDVPKNVLDKICGEEACPSTIREPEMATDGLVTFNLSIEEMDYGDVEQSVWQVECFPSDSSYQEFTARFAEEPTCDKAALVRALKDKFSDVHPQLLLTDESPLMDYGLFQTFRARVQESAPPLPPRIKPQVSAEAPRDDIYPAQWLMALELAERIRRIYEASWCAH